VTGVVNQTLFYQLALGNVGQGSQQACQVAIAGRIGVAPSDVRSDWLRRHISDASFQIQRLPLCYSRFRECWLPLAIMPDPPSRRVAFSCANCWGKGGSLLQGEFKMRYISSDQVTVKVSGRSSSQLPVWAMRWASLRRASAHCRSSSSCWASFQGLGLLNSNGQLIGYGNYQINF
jgi:hypothetical protein